MGAKDKERYENELREYRLKGKSGALPEATVEKASFVCAGNGDGSNSKPVQIDCNQNQLVMSSSSSEQEDPANQFQSNTLAPAPQAEVQTHAPNQWFINS